MRHKYLNAIGIESNSSCVFNTTENDYSRDAQFSAERETYGFDSRETWDIGYTLITWLYSHLKMYLEVSCVDLTYHVYDIPMLEDIPTDELEYYGNTPFVKECQREILVKDVTEEDCIKTAIKYMETYLLEDRIDDDNYEQRGIECAECALKIVAEIFSGLWW